MKLEIKFFSSRSGKSMILKVEDKTYVFNIFEGFQRYCIETTQSLNTISAIFLTNKFNVPPLMAIYLTLLDAHCDGMDVVSSFDVDFKSIHVFAYSPKCTFEFKNEFHDKFITVKNLENEDATNFVISFAKIRGTFYPKTIPENIPKNLYKNLISDGILEFEGKTLCFSDYSDPETQINDICLVFSEMNLENLPKNLKCYFCFNYSAYLYLRDLYPVINCDASESINNLRGIYYISDNQSIEYVDFYDQQVILNKSDSRYALPYNFNEKNGTDLTDCSILYTENRFVYSKNVGFSLNRKTLRYSEHKNSLQKTEFPAFNFLGTGCAIPSKYRNVSAILYQNSDCAILLDCGEDTLFQIERMFGDFSILEKLRIIYISHSHADHMLGVASVVQKCRNHLFIVAPDDTKSFLKYFNLKGNDENSELQSDAKFTFVSTTPAKVKGMEFYRLSEMEINNPFERFIDTKTVGDFIFRICGCIHSKSSTSVSIFNKSTGKTFSYSGDTMPSLLFAHLSAKNDVMIHEATFITGQEENARKTFHSLRDQAIEIFKLSHSKKLILTHFSNRNQNDFDIDKQVDLGIDIEQASDFFIC